MADKVADLAGPGIGNYNELARDFGLSTEQFIRSFAKRTGKTPKQYIIQLEYMVAS